MTTRLGRLIALVAVSVGMALAMSASAAYAAEGPCSNIIGAGSSLQGVAQKEVWIPGFEAQSAHTQIKCNSKIVEKPTVAYTVSSSGRGLNCWGASTGAFVEKECETGKELPAYIDTDVAPEGPAQAAGTQLFDIAEAGKQKGTEPNQVTAVPVAQSAITVVVSLPENCQPAVQKQEEASPIAKVKAAELAQEWHAGQPKLSQLKLPLGPGCQAVQTKGATLFARSKPSGTTAGFKRFLAQVSPTEWGSFVTTAAEAESTNWPTNSNIQVANGSGGEEAEKVFNTPNSMGYADLSDARAKGFTLTPTQHKTGQGKIESFYVEVQNNSGEKATPTYVSPEVISTGESNCSEATYEGQAKLKVGQDVDWSGAKQNNATKTEGGVAAAYPLCTLTFDIAWEHYSFFKEEEAFPSYKSDEGTADTVLDYLAYIVGQGQTVSKLKSSHYAPLPPAIRTLAEAGVNKTNIGL
jgi:hypothetical protein